MNIPDRLYTAVLLGKHLRHMVGFLILAMLSVAIITSRIMQKKGKLKSSTRNGNNSKATATSSQ